MRAMGRKLGALKAESVGSGTKGGRAVSRGNGCKRGFRGTLGYRLCM